MPIVIDERDRSSRTGLRGFEDRLCIIAVRIDQDDLVFFVHLEGPRGDDDATRGADAEITIDFDTHIVSTVRPEQRWSKAHIFPVFAIMVPSHHELFTHHATTHHVSRHRPRNETSHTDDD